MIIIISVVYFVGVIVLAHFFAQPGYHWALHTVSDLAAQGHTRKWIMQTGFIGFGLLLNLGIIISFITAQQMHYPDILIMLFGLSILLSGFFCAKPIDKTLCYSQTADRWHSIFAFIAGICFSAAMVWYIFEAGSISEGLFHAVFWVAVMGTTVLIGLAENGKIKIGTGLAQKTMYLISFAWLVMALS